MPGPERRTRARTIAAVLLVVYLIAALLIAFWPEPVDRNAVGLLDRIEQLIPWATYRRIEFAANVVFFVPLGFLLAVLLEKSRYLVLPIGLVTTVVIEVVQGELLDQRTASIADVIANTTGACIGLILAALLVRPQPEPRYIEARVPAPGEAGAGTRIER